MRRQGVEESRRQGVEARSPRGNICSDVTIERQVVEVVEAHNLES